MSILKQILLNDIKDIIGHAPSKDEFTSAVEYINDVVRNKDCLVDIEIYLLDWRHDCLLQCTACGDYFLSEQIQENDFGERYCSSACETYLSTEHENNKPERFGAYEYGVGQFGPFANK